MSHRFNGDIGAAAFGQFANLLHGVLRVAGDQQFIGAHRGGAIKLRLAASDGDHSRAVGFGQADEHQADGAEADYGYVVAGAMEVSSKPRSTQASGSTKAAS